MRSMKKGISLILTVCMLFWLGPVTITHAETTTDENGFTVDDTGTLIAYSGAGGSITIPSTVSSIAGGVFASNTAITSVTIPSYVTSMGTAVFYDCTNLSTVVIEGNIDSIPAQTFYNCTSLGSVSIPASVSAIGSQAFAECNALAALTIPDSVTSIGEKAFYDCASLSSIAIPAATTSIGNSTFSGCTRLTAISVATGNATYASSDGCLYNKAMTKLIRCPEGRSSATVASGTTTIGSGSFEDCNAVVSLSLPESVTTIEGNAFSGSGISTIMIPSSVTSIASQSGWTPSAISGYSGSQAQTYATGNGISFQALDSPSKDESTNTSDTNTSTGTTTGNTTTGSTAVGAASTAQKGSSNTGATSNVHEKDTTPTTGDGINPVFFLCFAILLIGVYFVLMNKKKVRR